MKNLLRTTVSALAMLAALGLSGTGVAQASETIVRDPAAVPAPITRSEPATVKVELETIERVADLNDGSTYRYWTFNGQVPGPMIRARVGDTVEVTMKNAEDSWMFHNVDFHAVTGPHGGGSATMRRRARPSRSASRP